MASVKQVRVKNLTLGDGSIVIQSMLSRPSDDIEGNVAQAQALELAGCEMIRFAIPDVGAIKLIEHIKAAVNVPLVADIHFDYRLALQAVNAGIDKIRINPGNIGAPDRVKVVANACANRGVPIRIGVNSGSLNESQLAKYGSATPEALVESALEHASLLERFDFDNIVISIKSSNVKTMVESYRLLAQKCTYPLHLGVTEAGTEHMGVMKSAIGIGALLLDGIGDTIRVSLTADPLREVAAAKDILKAIGRGSGVNIISCPTCGRTKIDIISIANTLEKALANCNKHMNLAVMGCAVNGPGEAREADLGVAGGDGCGLIFKKGKIVRKVTEDSIVDELLREIEAM